MTPLPFAGTQAAPTSRALVSRAPGPPSPRRAHTPEAPTLVSVRDGILVGRVGADHVADPAEQAARADPEAGRDDEPEQRAQQRPVIELPRTGHDERQQGGEVGLLELHAPYVARTRRRISRRLAPMH